MGQGKLNHSFSCLGVHVNDIRKMTASLVISLSVGERGRRERGREKESNIVCSSQLVRVCVGESVCVCLCW